MHMRDTDRGDILINRIHDFVGLGKTNRVTFVEFCKQSLHHVIVGWKVTAFHDNDAPIWLHLERGGNDFVKIDANRVRHHDFIGIRTDNWCDLAAQGGRQLIPTGCVHAADQSFGPFVFDDLFRASGGRERHCSEGVAIEIDDVVRQEEFVTKCGQRVRLIKGLEFGACSCHAGFTLQ